jgi:hypothetical protein
VLKTIFLAFYAGMGEIITWRHLNEKILYRQFKISVFYETR